VRVEPIEYLVGVVSREVVHDDVTATVRAADVDDLEQVDEGRAVVVRRAEAERLSSLHLQMCSPGGVS
jgi:hypothetical protein